MAHPTRVVLLALLLVLPVQAAPKFFPLDAMEFSPLKADPTEFRSGLHFIRTDQVERHAGGPAEAISRGGLNAVMYQFDLNPEMTAQLTACVLGQGRFDLSQNTDLLAEDWRYGLMLMTRWEAWSYRFDVLHHSAHFGDEFLVRTGAARHLEYVSEETGLTVGYDFDPHLRFYYGGHFAVAQSHTKKPARVQAGCEYYLEERYFPGGLGPYVALDLASKQEAEWRVTHSLVLGWALPGLVAGRSLDLQLFHVAGPTNLGEFYTTDETYTGLGFSVDL